MNILVPHKWLLEHLETEATPAHIQEHLSLAGPSVERLYERHGDTVYDIEVTTNRVDSMSVRGIAREAAVILSNAGLPSRLKPLELPEVVYEGEKLALPQILNQSLLCDRILCVILDNVQHGPSPDWLQERLAQVELNAKDVVIDITNAVSHELGHPCHAFDYDKVMQLGGEIYVVEAEAGMPFVTLDGAEYTTKGGEVVFVNGTGTIIDLPGIMGTLNTAVDDSTQRVLLWVESIAAEKIRFASMTHGIRTPAAQMNERDLDHELGREVLLRATAWYQELTGARVASMLYDEVARPLTRASIQFPASEIERYLGIPLPAEQVESILRQLGCSVEPLESGWQVTPPHFRSDLEIPADLVEEVVRIYGYHKLPSRVLSTEIPVQYPDDTNFEAEELITQTLADLGYQEQITYSLVAPELDVRDAVALKNPLTLDKQVLRTHLLPSHLEVMRSQWTTSSVRGTFELANVYHSQANSLPDEYLILGVTDRDLRALRSSLEVVWNRLFIDTKKIKITHKNHKKGEYIDDIFESAALITHDDRVLGTIGWITKDTAGLELEWRELLAVARRWPRYLPLAKTAPLVEDWTVVVADKTPLGEIVQTILDSDQRVTTATLVSQYENKWTFRVVLHDRERQLESATAASIRSKATQALASLGAQL